RHTRFSREWSSDVCSSDLRRVHVEYHQAAVATEHAVLLEGNIHIQLLGYGQELGTQRRRVRRLTTHEELDAALALIGGHAIGNRSEERRVGKGGRSGRGAR